MCKLSVVPRAPQKGTPHKSLVGFNQCKTHFFIKNPHLDKMVSTVNRRVTRIFDEYYDVTDFDHPGGATALSLCVGRDATEIFHTSHQFADQTKIKAMLNKYRVEPTDEEKKEIPSNDIFDWKETLNSAFYKELREQCM